MPRRHFLSWKEPLLPAAVRWLARDWRGGPLDLSDTAVVVPTAQAGRLLREALARYAAGRDAAVLSPRIVTPDWLIDNTVAEMPNVARAADTLLAWMQALQDCDLAAFTALFPVPPANRDALWSRSTASGLLRLRARLEEGGRGIAETARRIGPDRLEADRWAALARLESLAERVLTGAALTDRLRARLAASMAPLLPPEVVRLVVLAVPDPAPLVIAALESAERRGAVIDVVIHADDGLFDAWGRPDEAAWAERVIDIPESAQRIRMVARPEDEADALLAELQASLSAPDEVAIGSADPEVAAHLTGRAAAAGLEVFDPGGMPLGQHEVLWFLTTLTEWLRTDSFAAAGLLLRVPEVLQAAAGGARTTPVLREWDRLQREHLPLTLSDAMAFTESRVPESADDSASHEPVLTNPLRWLEAQRHILVSARDAAVLTAFVDELYAGRTFDSPAERSLFLAAMDQWDAAFEAVERAVHRGGYPLPMTERMDVALHLLRDNRLYADNVSNAPALHGWLELAWQDAPHLVIAGLNEGFAPESVTGDAWLPDSVRGVLDLKTNAQRLARDSYLLTSIIECRRAPQGRVTLLAARSTSAGDPLKPSRLLLRCADDELPARALRLFPDESAETPPRLPAAWHRAWRLKVPAPPRDAKVFQRLSVTQFSDYLACPFRFYLKHVLDMEPDDAGKDEMDPRDFGGLVHDALQALHEGELKDSDDPDRITAFLHDAAETAARKKFGAALSVPLLIQLASAKNRLAAAARLHAAERAAGWRVERVEVPFTMLPGHTTAFKIDGVELRGRIDLIERNRYTNALRILDYKTASEPVNPREHHLKNLSRVRRERTLPPWQRLVINGTEHAWTNLQLPLYVWIVRCLYERDVETGYMNLPRATSQSCVAMWPDLSAEQIDHARACAGEVVKAIKACVFWPPATVVKHDDFRGLWFDDIESSFDPSLLAKYREVIVGNRAD